MGFMTAVFFIGLGIAGGYAAALVRRNVQERSLIEKDLKTLGKRLDTVRYIRLHGIGDPGPAGGLAAWVRTHTLKLLDKSKRLAVHAGEISQRDPRGARQVKREIELNLAALEMLAECSDRYMEPLVTLQRQGLKELLTEVTGLQERLLRRTERQAALLDMTRERQQLALVGRQIEQERTRLVDGDPVAAIRRLTAHLRLLNDAVGHIDTKAETVRPTRP